MQTSIWETGRKDGDGFADYCGVVDIFCWVGTWHSCVPSLPAHLFEQQQLWCGSNQAELGVLNRLVTLSQSQWGRLAAAAAPTRPPVTADPADPVILSHIVIGDFQLKDSSSNEKFSGTDPCYKRETACNCLSWFWSLVSLGVSEIA